MPHQVAADSEQHSGSKHPLRWYTREAVAEHNAASDCWLTLHGDVLDITPLLAQYKSSPLAAPLVARAGTDISDWFVPGKRELRTHVNVYTGLTVPLLPEGRFIHVPPATSPRSDWQVLPADQPEWWCDPQYVIGRVTKQPRHINIVNLLTEDAYPMLVCEEDTLSRIQERYQLENNGHVHAYVWKWAGRLLDMTATLTGNGIRNDVADMDRVGMRQADWAPTLHLHFADDLTTD